MKITKNELSRALRVLGKVVCQTSPVELYRSIRFVGDECSIRAMATDGVESVSVKVEAFADSAIDFSVPFKHWIRNALGSLLESSVSKLCRKLWKDLRFEIFSRSWIRRLKYCIFRR